MNQESPGRGGRGDRRQKGGPGRIGRRARRRANRARRASNQTTRTPWRRLARIAAVPVALVTVGGLGYGAANSSLVDVRRVDVVGASHLSRDRVVELSGIDGSTNVLWLRAHEVEARLEREPWIASATVRRDLPSTVRIEIRERVAVAQVPVGRTMLLVARDGTVLDAAPRDPDLPLLDVPGAFTLGRRVPALVGPARVAANLRPEVRTGVDWIVPEEDGTLMLRLARGATVYFGPPVSITAKDRALAGVMRWMRENDRDLLYVDVRAPLAPAGLPLDVPAAG